MKEDFRLGYYRSELKSRLYAMNDQFKSVVDVDKSRVDGSKLDVLDVMVRVQHVLNDKCCEAELDACLYNTSKILKRLENLLGGITSSMPNTTVLDPKLKMYEEVKLISTYRDMLIDYICCYRRYDFLVRYLKDELSSPSGVEERYRVVSEAVSELADRAEVFAQWNLLDGDREVLEEAFIACRNLELHVRLLRSEDILPNFLNSAVVDVRREACRLCDRLKDYVFENEDGVTVAFTVDDILEKLKF